MISFRNFCSEDLSSALYVAFLCVYVYFFPKLGQGAVLHVEMS